MATKKYLGEVSGINRKNSGKVSIVSSDFPGKKHLIDVTQFGPRELLSLKHGFRVTILEHDNGIVSYEFNTFSRKIVLKKKEVSYYSMKENAVASTLDYGVGIVLDEKTLRTRLVLKDGSVNTVYLKKIMGTSTVPAGTIVRTIKRSEGFKLTQKEGTIYIEHSRDLPKNKK